MRTRACEKRESGKAGKQPLICNSKQYYAMFKITKCENGVVYLHFALIGTGRLKPGKVLKVIFAWIKVVPVLHFLCQ